jgi:hypothetical protein
MKTTLVASLSVVLAVGVGAPVTATGQSAGTDSATGAASECLELFELEPGQIV